MMWQTDPTGNAYNVEAGCSSLKVRIGAEPCYSHETSAARLDCYGVIYNPDALDTFDLAGADDDALADLVNRLGGYYCLVLRDHRDGTTRLATDLYGNYRLYSIIQSQTTIVSDDWRVLVEELRGGRQGLQFDAHERYYFRRHRYTTGGGTYVKGLAKVLPGSLITQREGRLTWRACLRTAIKKQPDDAYYCAENLRLVTQTIRDGIDPTRPTFLFFSGGIDSTFLACAMKAAEMAFTPLLVKYTPVDHDNLVDQKKAEAVAATLGLPLLTTGVDLNKYLHLVDRVALRHPFDMPYPVPFEYIHSWLAEKYGPCNIVNGQSSDSIYCWGASGKTTGSFLQRFLVNDMFTSKPAPVRKIIAGAIGAVYRRRWQAPYSFRVPSQGDDYWVGLLDPQGYLPVVHTDTSYADYDGFLRSIVQLLRQALEGDSEALRIYMKMMYLQGPTNVYIIEAARAYGHKLILPFVDARILNLRRRCQNDRRDLIHPRYVLEETLREHFGFDTAVIDRAKSGEASETAQAAYEQTVREAYERWETVCRDLF